MAHAPHTADMPQPFYVGDRVICVDALPGATVKNGKDYTVYSCEIDRGGDGRQYWYVGVEGQGIRTHDRLRPSLFALISPPVYMTFSQLLEESAISAN